MNDLSQLTCWCISADNAGMNNQTLGLAEALGLTPTVQHVRQRVWWRFLPPRIWPHPLRMKKDGGTFAAPWPDVAISCGYSSVATTMAIKRASGGKTFTIHVQNPTRFNNYDMVVVPRHDGITGENVIVTRGAVHRVSAEKLSAARAKPDARFADLKRPLVSVLVGGTTRRGGVGGDAFRDLTEKLRAMATSSGASLAVTPSRRTGKENEAILREGLKDVPAWVWDGTGENPYFSMLAEADAIVVTGESVSMISEAFATGKPIYVYELYPDAKMQPMLTGLEKDGIIRRFDGKLEFWKYDGVDETAQVAAKIKPLLLKYTDNKNQWKTK